MSYTPTAEVKRVALPSSVAVQAEKARGEMSLSKFLCLSSTACAHAVLGYIQGGSDDAEKSERRDAVLDAMGHANIRLSIDGIADATPSLTLDATPVVSRPVPMKEQDGVAVDLARDTLTRSRFITLATSAVSSAVLFYMEQGTTDAEKSYRRDAALVAIKHNQVALIITGGAA